MVAQRPVAQVDNAVLTVQQVVEGVQAALGTYAPGHAGLDRTTSPEEFASLIGDLEERVFAELPDDTWVYPGHGDDTTLGAERPALPEWKSRGW